MPLDGFHVVRWASEQFGAMSAMYLGSFALVALIIGVSLLVGGAKQVPTSWALIVSGAAACILAYFIVGSAIDGAGQIQHNARVESAAWRNGPMVVAMFVFGIAGYMFRLGLRAWASEESSGKAFGLFFFLLFLSGGFVSVQLVRGGMSPVDIPERARRDPEDTRPINLNEQDNPVRRSVVAPRSR